MPRRDVGDERVGMEDTSREHDIDIAVLRALSSLPAPLGAREIRRDLAEHGWDVSEATVSRRLRALDGSGLSDSFGRKGRRISARGEQVLRIRLRGQEQQDLLRDLGEISSARDVIDLLEARRAIEPEAVRTGAGRADAESLAALQELMRRHHVVLDQEESPIPREAVLGFHRTITAFTGNRLIAAMARIALDRSLDRVEAVLDLILADRHTSPLSVDEHQKIYRAFANGDGAEAGRLMHEHLDRLIRDTENFAAEHSPELIERLLAERGDPGTGERRAAP